MFRLVLNLLSLMVLTMGMIYFHSNHEIPRLVRILCLSLNIVDIVKYCDPFFYKPQFLALPQSDVITISKLHLTINTLSKPLVNHTRLFCTQLWLKFHKDEYLLTILYRLHICLNHDK